VCTSNLHGDLGIVKSAGTTSEKSIVSAQMDDMQFGKEKKSCELRRSSDMYAQLEEMGSLAEAISRPYGGYCFSKLKSLDK